MLLNGRVVPSPPFICSFNHLCISVWTHGYLFYFSGYKAELCSIVSDSLQPTRLLCPWNFPGKNIGAGCHFLLQGIFPTHGSNLGLFRFLHWQVDSLPLALKSFTSDWDLNPHVWDSNPARTLLETWTQPNPTVPGFRNQWSSGSWCLIAERIQWQTKW